MFPKKIIFLWAILFITVVGVNAQNNTTLSVKPEFKLFFEKVYLHTDKDFYTAGDTLWYKAYLVNAQSNLPLSSSGNLQVDLISPDAKIISSETIRLDNGLGNGDFELTDSLPPGKYHLRAYTNWMRNFGDNFIFEKEINVFAEPASDKNLTDKNSESKPAVTVKANLKPVNSVVKELNLRFYPEGGSLVEGVSSLVAVKAENSSGKGMMAKGAVLSASGDTITRFSCDTLGMGLFALLPLKGQVYHADVELVNKSLSFDLPLALKEGLSLQVKQADTTIHVIISSSNVPSAIKKPSYTITVKHEGITLLSQQIQPEAQQTVVKISTTSLPEGISAITLYDDQNKPNCERLVYIHHPETLKAVLSTDKKTYQPKEKVTVNIKLNTSEKANLSVAAVDAGVVPSQADDIVSYLMLQSEIKGNVEQARHYFDTTNVNRFKQLDLLLMTQGWRDFIWRKLADTAIHISYAAENGISVLGKLIDEVKNKAMPNLNVSLYASEAKGNKIFATKSDATGRFNFSNLMFYGEQTIKLASVNDKGENKGSFMVDTITPMPVELVAKPATLGETAIDSLISTAINNRITVIKNNKINGVIKLKEVKIKERKDIHLNNGTLLTSWGSDQIFDIKPEDEKYKTLEWFLLQNCKGALQSTEPDITGVVYAGSDTSSRRYRVVPPYFFINGKELYMDEDAQAEVYRATYFNMPIQKFKKIVLKRMIGTLHGSNPNPYGRKLSMQDETTLIDRYLLYLTLKDNALIDNPGSLSTNVNGYYEAKAFYKPVYNTPAKPNKLDYRSTLHWEPNLTTNEKGEATLTFYNADPKTTVRIIVQGITNKGVPVSAVSTYTVGK